jgi:hypothetical protein
MLPWPLRSTTLTCRKASPDPSASCTKPNPLSGLYHLTTAWTGGPEGVSNPWALDPGIDPKLRRGVSKLSSSKPRRRVGRKSLSLLLTSFPGGRMDAPQSEMRRGDRQRIPRDERRKRGSFARGTESSNPASSSGESVTNRTAAGDAWHEFSDILRSRAHGSCNVEGSKVGTATIRGSSTRTGQRASGRAGAVVIRDQALEQAGSNRLAGAATICEAWPQIYRGRRCRWRQIGVVSQG